MTTTEHPALVALRQTLLTLRTPHARRNKPTGTSEGLALRACQDAVPAIEALIAERDKLRAALTDVDRWVGQSLMVRQHEKGDGSYLAMIQQTVEAALAKGGA